MSDHAPSWRHCARSRDYVESFASCQQLDEAWLQEVDWVEVVDRDDPHGRRHTRWVPERDLVGILFDVEGLGDGNPFGWTSGAHSPDSWRHPVAGPDSGSCAAAMAPLDARASRCPIPSATDAAPSDNVSACPCRQCCRRSPKDASFRRPSDVEGRFEVSPARGSSGSRLARVASWARVREVADPKCRCAGASRPRWIHVTPRGALPDPRPRWPSGRQRAAGGTARRRCVSLGSASLPAWTCQQRACVGSAPGPRGQRRI